MKTMLTLSALAMAVLGTSLWAQQDDDPPPAQAPQPASLGTDERSQPAGLADAAASPGTSPLLNPLNSVGTQPAQPSIPRASSPGARSGGSGRSVGGPARPARPDLEMLPGTASNAYAPYTTPIGALPPGFDNPGMYQPPRYSNNVRVVNSPDGKSFAYVGPDGRQFGAATAEDLQRAEEFRKTVEELRKAKTEEEKTDIRTKLNDLVSKQIDQDLAEREKRLTELEAKAKQLRDQLQQRKQSKADIQKMLVMLIENPQGGLGLPPAWMNAINEQSYTLPQFTPVYQNAFPAMYPGASAAGQHSYTPN